MGREKGESTLEGYTGWKEESGTAEERRREKDLRRKGSSQGEKRRKKRKDLRRKGTVRLGRSEVENIGKETSEAGGE